MAYMCQDMCQGNLKVHGPISQNGVFYSNDATSPKKSWFQISIQSIKQFGRMMRLAYIANAYTLTREVLHMEDGQFKPFEILMNTL